MSQSDQIPPMDITIVKPLEPNERIELEKFRAVLQDTSTPVGTDIAQLLQTTTDLIGSGRMSKDDALRGLVNCLIVRVVSYRDECLAHRKEAEQWQAKWRSVVDAQAILDPAQQRSLPPSSPAEGWIGELAEMEKKATDNWSAHPQTSNGWEIRAKKYPIVSSGAAEIAGGVPGGVPGGLPVFIEPWSRFTTEAYKDSVCANFQFIAALRNRARDLLALAARATAAEGENVGLRRYLKEVQVLFVAARDERDQLYADIEACCEAVQKPLVELIRKRAALARKGDGNGNG